MNTFKTSKTVFHPSIYEAIVDTPYDGRTLLNIRKERSQRLTEKRVEDLKSPGTFKLIENDKSIAKSNTKYLFKNLYGETLLTQMFFSKKNIENIQKIIKFVVHRETGYVVDDQSYNELLIIMRSIFLEYSAHPLLIDDSMDENTKKMLYQKYKNEVKRLNDITANAIIPKLVSQLQQYVDYLRDASTQPYQVATPQNVSIAGQRDYRSITQVLLGGNL